jgi:hypothetical protein
VDAKGSTLVKDPRIKGTMRCDIVWHDGHWLVSRLQRVVFK